MPARSPRVVWEERADGRDRDCLSCARLGRDDVHVWRERAGCWLWSVRTHAPLGQWTAWRGKTTERAARASAVALARRLAGRA